MALKQSTSNNVLHLKDAQSDTQQSAWHNVGTLERWISGVGGGALAAYGVWRRDWLGAGLAVLGGNFIFRSASGHSFVYQALEVNTADTASNAVTSVPHNEGVKIEHVVTIDKAPEELYRFWRNFRICRASCSILQSVTVKDSIHSHWVANAPPGRAWNGMPRSSMIARIS